jgi:hypothetical protein
MSYLAPTILSEPESHQGAHAPARRLRKLPLTVFQEPNPRLGRGVGDRLGALDRREWQDS